MDGFVLTFCQQWTHLYALPPDDYATPLEQERVELDPVASHRWNYRMDFLKILPLSPHPLTRQFRASSKPQRPSPITIFIRFDSWYPWPVNILHQYILPPNSAFDPTTYVRPQPGTPVKELPYLHSSSSFGSLKPYVATSISSPVRVFTPSDMTIGAYRTALWLDAQTDMAPSQAGDRGQRIAGRVLRYVPPPAEERTNPRHAVDLQVQLTEGETSNVAGYGDEQLGREMLFHLQEESEEWGRIALSDDEGKMAISCVDGRILVYDYT